MAEVVTSPPAQISPVRDPNYENFNYGALLNQAGEPLRELGQGKLALAQQQGARTFDLLSQQKASDLAGEREQARLQTEASIAEMTRLRLKNEGANQIYADVQQTHPEFQPDPKKTLAENVAAANELKNQDILNGVKTNSDALNATTQQLQTLQKNAGQVRSIYDPQVNAMTVQKLITNPALTKASNVFPDPLTPKDIADLQKGGPGNSIEDIAARKFKTNGAAILSAANDARSQAQQAILANDQQALALNKDILLSKANTHQTALQGQLAWMQQNRPDLMARAAPLISATPVAAAGPPKDPNGLLPGLSGATATTPPAPTNPTAAAPGTTPPIVVPPGTPQAQDPNFYLNQAELEAHKNAAATADSEIQSAQAQKQDLINKLQPGASTTNYGTSAIGSEYGGFFGQPGSSQRGYSNEEKLQFSKDLLAVNKQIDTLQKTKQSHVDALSDLTPATVPPPTNGQSPPMQSAPGVTSPPLATPQPAPAQPPTPGLFGPMNPQQGQPQAGNGQQPQMDQNQMAARNKLFSIVGTSDPQELQRLGQFAQMRLGMSQQQVQQLLVGAISGDSNATARVQQIVAQSKANQSSSGGVSPDASQYGGLGMGIPPMAQPTAPNASPPVMDFSQ